MHLVAVGYDHLDTSTPSMPNDRAYCIRTE